MAAFQETRDERTDERVRPTPAGGRHCDTQSLAWYEASCSRLALAAVARSLPRVGQRNHVAADAGRYGQTVLRAVRRSISLGRLARGRREKPRCCGCGKGWATTAAPASCTRPLSRSLRNMTANFPTAIDDVQALPGIGRYTAGAILVDRLRPAAADSGREYDPPLQPTARISGDPRRAEGQRRLWEFAAAILPRRQVGVCSIRR